MPWRTARHLFSVTKSGSSGARPSAPATRHWTRATRAAVWEASVCTSGARSSTVPNLRWGRASHQHQEASGMLPEATRVSMWRTKSSQPPNAGGRPERGNISKILLRVEASLVSVPRQNGELAESATSSGTRRASSLTAPMAAPPTGPAPGGRRSWGAWGRGAAPHRAVAAGPDAGPPVARGDVDVGAVDGLGPGHPSHLVLQVPVVRALREGL